MALNYGADTDLTSPRTRIHAGFRWRSQYIVCQLRAISGLGMWSQMGAMCTMNSKALSTFLEPVQDHLRSVEGTTHFLPRCVSYSTMQHSASGEWAEMKSAGPEAEG